MTLEQAIAEAMRYSIDHDIMRDYLLSKEKDVLKMLKYEWNEEEARQAIREVGYEEGLSQGISQGVTNSVRNLIKSMKLSPDAAMNALMIPTAGRPTILANL